MSPLPNSHSIDIFLHFHGSLVPDISFMGSILERDTYMYLAILIGIGYLVVHCKNTCKFNIKSDGSRSASPFGVSLRLMSKLSNLRPTFLQ